MTPWTIDGKRLEIHSSLYQIHIVKRICPIRKKHKKHKTNNYCNLWLLKLGIPWLRRNTGQSELQHHGHTRSTQRKIPTPCQRNSRQLHSSTPGQVHRRIAQWNFLLGLVYISFARVFSSNMRVAPVDSSLSSFYQFRPQHGVVIGKRLSTSILCAWKTPLVECPANYILEYVWLSFIVNPKLSLKKHPSKTRQQIGRKHAYVWPKSPHNSGGSWKCLNRSK